MPGKVVSKDCKAVGLEGSWYCFWIINTKYSAGCLSLNQDTTLLIESHLRSPLCSLDPGICVERRKNICNWECRIVFTFISCYTHTPSSIELLICWTNSFHFIVFDLLDSIQLAISELFILSCICSVNKFVRFWLTRQERLNIL